MATVEFWRLALKEEGITQYRVQQVDIDGKFKYSSIIHFNKHNLEVVVRTFPLPATNSLTVQHPAGHLPGSFCLGGSGDGPD